MIRRAAAGSALLAALLLAASAGRAAGALRRPAGPLDAEAALGLLKRYVEIDTANPPGNELAAARFLKGLLDAEGIASEIYESTPGRANLVARLPARGKPQGAPLLMVHHMDVVPADAAEWSSPPFSPEEKDGYLQGRGSLDSKITGVLHFLTLARLKRENVRLNRDVYLLALADEEAGGRWGIQWMLEKSGVPLNPGFVIDEGGFGFTDAFSSDDVTYYACAVEEKKVLGLRVTAQGRSGHGSIPNRANPDDILRRALFRMEKAFLRARGRVPEITREMERLVHDPKSSPLWDAARKNTWAVTSLVAYSGRPEDPEINMVPAKAQATVDCRLLPGVDEFALFNELKAAVADDRVTVEIVQRTQVKPVRSETDTAFFRALERAVKLHDPEARVIPFLYPAATDSRHFRAKGAVCYGLVPLPLKQEDFLRLHAPDERLPVAGLEKAVGIMYDWVKFFAERSAGRKTDDGPD